MGTTSKWTNDWKFWLQLMAIGIAIGGAHQAYSTMRLDVEDLKRNNRESTESLIRVREQMKQLESQNADLKELLRRLEQRLELKKVVYQISESSPIVGEFYVER
jgi:predicted nuclease with TOPRIM domain